MILSNVWIYT